MAAGTFYTTRTTDQDAGKTLDDSIVALEAAIVAAGSLPVSPATAAGPWWVLTSEKGAASGVPTLDATGAIVQYSKRLGWVLPLVLGSGQSIVSGAAAALLTYDITAITSGVPPVYYDDGFVPPSPRSNIVIPATGTYFFYFTLGWEQGVVYITADPLIYIYVNGAELWRQTAGKASDQITQHGFFPVKLTIGDVVTMKASQTSTGGVNRILSGWVGMYKVAA